VLTTLYLVRHAATAANLAKPARLQGRNTDPPLAEAGILQANATCRLLGGITFDDCYTSPLRRAVETAEWLVAPRLTPIVLEALTECDVGRWEGQSWEEIREREPELYAEYMADPGNVPYAGGESFADVAARTAPVINGLLEAHPGKTLLIVSHHVVNRVYLASVLGMSPSQARLISLDNCGVSIVTREHGKSIVRTLNSAFHIQKSV